VFKKGGTLVWFEEQPNPDHGTNRQPGYISKAYPTRNQVTGDKRIRPFGIRVTRESNNPGACYYFNAEAYELVED